MQHVSTFSLIFVATKTIFTMNKYLPVSDRIFEKEKKSENWVDKQDRRNEIKTDIAVIIGATSVIAGTIVAPHVFHPALFNDTDVLILIYTVVSFFVTFWLLLSANYIDNPHHRLSSGDWWWWNV